MNKHWISIFIAGIFEILWVIGLKNASNWITWIGTIIAFYISFDMLIRATKKLPVGTVYAVFTGIGTVGAVGIEMIFFGEPFRWMKALLILLLISGVFGLKMITKEDSNDKGVAT